LDIEGNEVAKVVQAYADDLLIFTDNRENLNTLTEAVSYFMSFARIKFSPYKCRLIVYNPAKEMDIPLFLPDNNNEKKTVKICNVDDTVKYLGVPLGIKKLAKMRFKNQRIMNIRKILYRIRFSGLKITQVIHAIKTFIEPRLNYSMMNRVVSKTELNKLDGHIRKIINEMIGGPPLSKDMFYSS
jgi:hypothetical protein